jgi:hypothetical protein
MGKGLANALLISSREAFRGATPIDKVTTPGFLQYLLNNNKPTIIGNLKDDGSGYLRDVKVRYRQRGVPGKTVTTDDCTVQVKPAYQELTVPATQFRALGIAFEDDQIAKFEQDALAQIGIGNPQMTSVMKDVYEAIIEQANGFFADINTDLLALQAAAFGKNIVPGNNAARTINFPLNATNNDLASGMTLVQADAMANETRLNGSVVVGSGLVNNYFLQQAAKSAAQNGLDTSKQFLPAFYYDPYAQTGWGANQFGLFEKDAVQFVNTCRFRGAKAGQKGGDFFMTLKLPIVDSLGQGTLGAFEFDVQLTYRTCPGNVQIGTYAVGTNEPVALGRGWNVILMSSYQTVNIPSTSYAAGDRLNGVNGTFRYVATNA